MMYFDVEVTSAVLGSATKPNWQTTRTIELNRPCDNWSVWAVLHGLEWGLGARPGSFAGLARLKPLNPTRGGTARKALLAGAVAIFDRMPGERAQAFSTNIADAREGKMRRGDEFATRGKI